MTSQPEDYLSFLQECLRKIDGEGWKNVCWDTFLMKERRTIDPAFNKGSMPLPPIKTGIVYITLY